MSTSLLYHSYGIQHQEYLKTEYSEGSIIFHIRTKPSDLRCSHCNSYNVRPRGVIYRKFKVPPIGNKQVFLKAKIQRLECRDCQLIRQEKINYADYKKTYTKSFQRYVIDLTKYMTILDVSRKLGVCWDMVKGIQKEYLQKHYGKPDLKHITQLAIDEIAVEKGHKYMTVVMDLGSGAVLFVGDGKDSKSLEPFWKRLKRAGTKIEAVSIDMSPAYIESVVTNLAASKIVFDHFHIIKLYNDKLSELRRDLYSYEIETEKKTIERDQVAITNES